MQVVDPRTEEEKINASDLQEIGLQQAKDKNYASGGWGYLLVGVLAGHISKNGVTFGING